MVPSNKIIVVPALSLDDDAGIRCFAKTALMLCDRRPSRSPAELVFHRPSCLDGVVVGVEFDIAPAHH
jgi:hypothetical protein